MPGKEDLVAILQIGVIGLGFLLAVLSYHLLTKEQKQESPRSAILNSIYIFMSFSVVLCVIGFLSQLIDTQKNDNGPQQVRSEPVAKKSTILYHYFVYSVKDQDLQLCNDSDFIYSEKAVETENISIEGKLAGKIFKNNRHEDFNFLTVGNINKYYFKYLNDDGVGYLEKKQGDYTGYWIGEAYHPGVNAVICPTVFSPNAKGLSEEEAKSRWPILNEPCRVISSLSDVVN